MPRPSSTARDDGGEVVVEQHEVRHLAAHVGAALAHGHADVRTLQRRRVVDAVAGHGHDRRRAAAAPRRSRSFCSGLTRAKTLHVRERRRSAPAGSKPSRSSPVTHAGAGHADLLRDGQRRGRMIARDHDDADARRLRRAHRVGHLGARRIPEQDQAEQREPILGLAVGPGHAPARDSPRARGPRPSASTTPRSSSGSTLRRISTSGAPFT